MLAQQVTELAGSDGLLLLEVAEPAANGRVAVNLHAAAAGVSYPDLFQTTGRTS